RLGDRLEAGEFVTAVCGLGYVGLPLASAVAATGQRVIGLDVDDDRIAEVNAGRLPPGMPVPPVFARQVDEGLISATSDFSSCAGADVVVICVPTPLAPDGA